MFKGVKGSVVCVECSLRDDCLRCYDFCRHSKSPIFNRSMRLLNRFPIYLGEDICDKINREAVLKDILIFDKKKLKSAEYATEYHYKGGRYSAERLHHTYHWISRSVYPTGYCWLQRSNDLDDMCEYGARASRNIESYYDDTHKAKKKFRNWLKSITHIRILSRFNLNMNKMYGEDTIEKRRYLPLWNEVKYWTKTSLDGYNPLRNNKPCHKILIKQRLRYICNGHKVPPCKKYRLEYKFEVDKTRINQLERYIKLYKSTDDKMEKYWYMMKMGMLCYSDKTTTDYKQSKDYSYLGTLYSHTKYVNDGRFPNNDTLNDWGSDDNHFWESPHLRQNYYDLRHRIYRLNLYYFSHLIFGGDRQLFHNFDIYNTSEQNNFIDLLTTDIDLPKINVIKHHYKKTCMLELTIKKRRIRNDCGRSRGPNIRTTNPYYCIFTLYPQI